MSWAFDYSKWDKVCHVDTTVPAGLPTIEEMLERFGLYELRLFDKNWEEYEEGWNAPLKETSLANCTSQGLSFKDFEKCIKNSSSDEWDEARIRRDFFYEQGDMFIVYGPCEDTLCLYILTQDFPATEENLTLYKKFNPLAPFWQKFYCVSTNKNRCLEYQRTKQPTLGYDLIQIGSEGHVVEFPVSYRLFPPVPDLDQRAQNAFLNSSKILTPEQIESLNPPIREEK
jgi:hypothetical protein